MKRALTLLIVLVFPTGCIAAADNVYRDPNMDFGTIETIAVLPFANLTRDTIVSERVRDVFITKLLAAQAVYVLPIGEVARGLSKAEIQNAASPSPEEVVKLGQLLKANAVMTGVVREYGEVRSGTTSGSVISMSLQMMETETGKIVWSASATKGGIGMWKRFIGGGGEPLNLITEKAIDELMDKLLGPPPKGK